MPKLVNRLPKYRLHKPSGQAVVTLNGFDHYLGEHGSEASKQAYQRKVTEWLASHKLGATTSTNAVGADFTIDEIFIRYWAHVQAYYVKDGDSQGDRLVTEAPAGCSTRDAFAAAPGEIDPASAAK